MAQTDRQTHRQAGHVTMSLREPSSPALFLYRVNQTDRETDRQTDRQTDRHTHTDTYTRHTQTDRQRYHVLERAQ